MYIVDLCKGSKEESGLSDACVVDETSFGGENWMQCRLTYTSEKASKCLEMVISFPVDNIT